MEKGYIKKRIFNLLIIAFILCIQMSCISKKEIGVTLLPEYRIKNHCLDSITALVIKESNILHKESKEIMVLELNEIDNDTIDFVYSFHASFDVLRDDFIELNNKRVIGYTNKEALDIVILTNINSYIELKRLKEFITPCSKTKEYENLYYSPPLGLDIESMYEPLLWHFKYKNGVVGKPSLHL